jgi:hypothetical protein
VQHGSELDVTAIFSFEVGVELVHQSLTVVTIASDFPTKMIIVHMEVDVLQKIHEFDGFGVMFYTFFPTAPDFSFVGFDLPVGLYHAFGLQEGKKLCGEHSFTERVWVPVFLQKIV